jgi:cellulose synthase/poly-beta-1,6-N-acetylglucosamine synthase-like glycosyltransferase
MVHEILIKVIAVVNVICLTHLGLYIVGANTYDILEFRKARAPKRRGREYRPLVSVVIPGHNDSKVIRRTIDSVRASSYTNIEIIIVDDGSTDRMASVVRNYIAKLPRPDATQSSFKTYRLVRNRRTGALKRSYFRNPQPRIHTVLVKQRRGGKALAMNNGIAKHAKGKLVMCLDADSILHKDAIQNAVRYFRDKRVMGVAANVRVMDNGSWLSRLQRFEHMIGYRTKKFFSLTNSEFIIGGVASTYRMSVLKKVGFYDNDTQTEDIGLSLKLIARQGNRDQRIVYAANVVAMTEGVQTYKALLRQRYRWKLGCLQNLFKYRALIGRGDRSKHSLILTKYRLPMAIVSELMLAIEPILISYLLYLSISYHTFGILAGAYATMTGYIMLTLWPDEHLTIREKLRLSLSGFFMYIVFFAMDFVQLAAIFRCLVGYKKIARPEDKGTAWTSPARAAQMMSFSR